MPGLRTEGYDFLNAVGKWHVRDIKVLAEDIENAADYVTVPMMVPLVRAIYRQLITVYYVRNPDVIEIIKRINGELALYQNVDIIQVGQECKQAISEWVYLNDRVIRGMYPLLMRMCSDKYEDYPEFFREKAAAIFKFLGITKFDLLLPEKAYKQAAAARALNESKAEESAAAKKRPERGAKDESVAKGLRILDQMFPKAGFLHLERHPDMFPYFQPLYNLADGFNVLAPENPLQVTIVLVVILEDFFKGCRNIHFNLEEDKSSPNSLENVLGNWPAYYEDYFAKRLVDYLSTYVNSIYSQKDFASSKFGRENLNNILWRIKYYFLPYYKFFAPGLQKPVNDMKIHPPLFPH